MTIKYVGVINKIEVRDSFKEKINRETEDFVKESRNNTDKVLQIFKGK